MLRAPHQTTVVAIRTADAVTLGADNRQRIDSGESEEAVPTSLTPKILQIRDVFVTCSGRTVIYGLEADGLDFDALALATEVFDSVGTVRQRLDELDRLIRSKLAEALRAIKLNSPDQFQQWYQTGIRKAVTMLVAGVEKRKPVLYVREYFVSDSIIPEVTSTKTNHNKRLPPDGKQVSLHGEHQLILEDMKRRDLSKPFDAVAMINLWIEMEAIANPNKVSLPVNIVVVNVRGLRWIQ